VPFHSATLCASTPPTRVNEPPATTESPSRSRAYTGPFGAPPGGADHEVPSHTASPDGPPSIVKKPATQSSSPRHASARTIPRNSPIERTPVPVSTKISPPCGGGSGIGKSGLKVLKAQRSPSIVTAPTSGAVTSGSARSHAPSRTRAIGPTSSVPAHRK
jgi:hypothetical protein